MPISINGSGTVTGISAGGLPDGCIATDDLANNAVTTAKLGSNEASGLCKAWVNFNGTAAGTFPGGTSTVTRVAGSTTATVTTTNNHGLVTGSTVNALTGVVAGIYTVTVLTSTTFTITTVATTALTNASITFAVNLIRASYNVSSITDNGVGDYTVNFTTPMPDANYIVAMQGPGSIAGTTWTLIPGLVTNTGSSTPTTKTTTAVRYVLFNPFSSNAGAYDAIDCGVAIFR